MVYDFVDNYGGGSVPNINVVGLNTTTTSNAISYEALKQGLEEVAQTGLWCYGQIGQLSDYYKNPNNYPYLLQAYNKWGGFPAKNRPSERRKDYCDFQDLYSFIFYAKLCQTYPTFQPNDKNTCYQLEGLLEALQGEKTAANQRNVAKGTGSWEYAAELGGELIAIDKKITEYNTLYSTLACDKVKQDDIDARAAEERAIAELNQKQLLADTFANAKQSEAQTNKIAIYAAIGVGVIIAGLVVIRALR